MNKWIAITIFFLFVLLFTRVDYLVHEELYDFGLEFSESWVISYWILYSLMFQLVILTITLASKSLEVFVFTEAFFMSCTQDVVFYGLWNKGLFPCEDWTWMLQYKMFGTWTTLHQIILSVVVLSAVLVILRVVKCYLKLEQSNVMA